MDISAHYRDMAARCVLLASTPGGTRDKALLLEMAQRWRDMADKAEGAQVIEGPETASGATESGQ
jgi:hypothetical protein